MVAAVLVGMIVRFFNRHVFWPDRLLERLARPGAAGEVLPLAQTAAYAPDAPWSSPLTGNTAPAAMPSAK